MGSGFAVGVLLAAVLCVQAAAEQFNFTLIAGDNTLCLGPDMGSMGQNTSDAASCEAACRKSPPCEFWSWCPTSAAGCGGAPLGVGAWSPPPPARPPARTASCSRVRECR